MFYLLSHYNCRGEWFLQRPHGPQSQKRSLYDPFQRVCIPLQKVTIIKTENKNKNTTQKLIENIKWNKNIWVRSKRQEKKNKEAKMELKIKQMVK